MATAYTSLLGLALPVTGELSGTWGDTVNNSITSLLDSAISGTTTISTDADITLTTTTGAANEAREAIILWTAGGTVTRNITAPAQSKTYIVINKSSSTQSIVLRGVGPTTGVTIIKGESAVCAWNGTDFIKVSNISGPGTFTDLTVTGNTSLGDADTDTITQAASYVTGTQLKSAKTATNTLNLAAYDTDGSAYTNLITLTASTTPTLALTSTGVGTINNMSVGATTASTGAFTTLSATGVATFSAGTAALPAITTTGDTNTGIFFPAADTIAFAEGGAEAMRIDSSGVVRINNTSNATFSAQLNTQFTSAFQCGQYLKVTDTSSSQSMFIFGNSSSDAVGGIATSGSATSYNTSATSGVIGVDASTVAFNTASSERMRIDSSGNVGIGTSSPNFKVSFGANIGNTFALFENAGASVYGVGMGGAGSGGDPYRLKLFSNGTENVCITDSGNVGIGTTTPIRKLTVSFAGSPELVLQDTTQAANSKNWRMFTTANTLVLGTLNDAGSSGNNYLNIDSSGSIFANSGVICFTTTQYRSNVASSQLQFINNSAGVSLAVNGTSWGSLSDERDKEIIEPITDAVSKVASLRSVIGRYKVDDADKRRAFLIAQDVKAVLPEAVTELEDEQQTLILQYTEVIPLLVAAIQELKAEFDAYKSTHP